MSVGRGPVRTARRFDDDWSSAVDGPRFLVLCCCREGVGGGEISRSVKRCAGDYRGNSSGQGAQRPLRLPFIAIISRGRLGGRRRRYYCHCFCFLSGECRKIIITKSDAKDNEKSSEEE